MEYRRLGTTGLKVSAIGLGGNTFGGTADEAQSVAVIQQAIELGVNFIDSADSYGRGKSEEFVAKAVEGRRHDVIIATKVASAVGEGPNDRGLSRKHIMDGAEASLKRLNTDYIDLFYAHQFDPQTPIEESVRAFDDLVRQGKVRYLACSNWQAWQLAHSLGIQERLGLSKWTAIQPSWNIVDGLADPALEPACEALGVGVIPYRPMGSGVLTGKYRRGEPPPPGTRLSGNNNRLNRQLNDKMLSAVDALKPWAESRGHTVGQLAISWLLAHPVVSSVIVGARNAQQVTENVAAGNWSLTVEEREELRGLARPERLA
jgi:aryl-alcohol dehydrogenase-like predicted oxidoreductase